MRTNFVGLNAGLYPETKQLSPKELGTMASYKMQGYTPNYPERTGFIPDVEQRYKNVMSRLANSSPSEEQVSATESVTADKPASAVSNIKDVFKQRDLMADFGSMTIEEAEKRLAQVRAEKAFRSKLKRAKNDPLWGAARLKFVLEGDISAMQNIMDKYDRLDKEAAQKDLQERQFAYGQEKDKAYVDLQREMNKNAKEQEKASKQEANLRAANTARAILEDAYDVYMANKASKENQIQGRSNLFRAYQDFKDKADAAGKEYNDFFADKTFMQNVDLELQEALATTQAETEKKVANAKAAANTNALKNSVKSKVDFWNTGTHTSKETNDEINRLKAAYPQFDFKKKGGKIEQSYNPKKDGKK